MNDFSLPDGASLTPEGLFKHLLRRTDPGNKRPALFLDRDGVLVEEVGYLHRPEEVRLIEGTAEVVARANAAAVHVIIVTNQGGIGLGKYGWRDFILTQEKIYEDLRRLDAEIDATMASPYHPRGNPPFDRGDHPSRKPNPGMLLEAATLLSIDYAASWIIGDHGSDIEAGRNAGLVGGLHVLTGHGTHDGERDKALAAETESYKPHAIDSIADALTIIPFLKK
ncbi:MAG: HAD-IIIA family hydrolase [Rhodospirillales bacterium]